MKMTPALAVVLLFAGSLAAQPPPSAALQQAYQSAAARVAPSVVQIDTTGGTEVLDQETLLRRGTGPTTGLVVAADGYIISSAFNFANKPVAVFVAVPGRAERFPAKVVATDHTRMLTLLKIEATGLPVPEAAPKKETRIGQWALALGRALTGAEGPPSVSAGVVSAVERIQGKTLQTDAKISPVNYGGPLVDLRGRVLGVLIPANPGSDSETAGVEWYDSGLGFAVPLDDIFAVLPKLRQGTDLFAGKLGIAPKEDELYVSPATVGLVRPNSPAAAADIQVGDAIVEINGRPIFNFAQVQVALGPKYEGDTVTLKLKRGKEEITKSGLTLQGPPKATENAFLGIVPKRDEADGGVGVRYVFPKSPAELAGIKAGDRLVNGGPATAKELRPVSNRDGLLATFGNLAPGEEIKLEVRHADGKTVTVTVKLSALANGIPADLPEPGSAGAAKVNPEIKKPPTGMQTRKEGILGGDYWLYVPENYDPKVSHALVIWLHAAGKGGKDAEDLVKVWKEACAKQHIIILGPKADSDTGWVASEAERVLEDVRAVLAEYTIDKQRVVAHGQAVGGQMAFYLGFTARDVIRGVATTGAVLASPSKENSPSERLAFFIVAGGKDPSAKQIIAAGPALTERKFPVIVKEVPALGRDYLDAATFAELVRWLDSLDRL